MTVLSAPKGTHDIFAPDVLTWQWVETTARQELQRAMYQEIRTPVFEATALFERGVGQTTDIVNKEMYTFEKEERSLTLRPENTAGVVRAYIEQGMSRWAKPVKLYYMGPMFRYERPQKGRQRQFHQLGIEVFGSDSPLADIEVMVMAMDFFTRLGLGGLCLNINNVGTVADRSRFKETLQQFLRPYLPQLCQDCQRRFETNPLRMLDCKQADCQSIYQQPDFQTLLKQDFTGPDAQAHFARVLSGLDALGIAYQLNPMLVRGLDYYTITVFEITSGDLGAQNTVCGGGRYNDLVQELGGPSTPAVGWALGMERLVSLVTPVSAPALDYFVVSDLADEAMDLARHLRTLGYSVAYELTESRPMAKQLATAAKMGALQVVMVGEQERQSHGVIVKNMGDGTQTVLSRQEFLQDLVVQYS